MFVEDYLLKELETSGFKCLVHTRDFVPGCSIPDNILTSVQNSRRTLIVLSQNYISSSWSRMEFRAANQLALQQNIERVIVVLLGDMPKVVDEDLKKYSFIKNSDPLFLIKLRYLVLSKKNNKRVTI